MDNIFLIVIMVLAVVILIIGLQGLVYWGMGAFICWAFNIPFEWGFVHGIALAFIVSILSTIFNYNKVD